MLDQFSQYFAQILSLSIGGVSPVTIIANVIYCTKSIAKAKQEVIANIRYWLPSKEEDEE